MLSILYASIEGAVRLNELVDAGLLQRRVLDTRPPAVEYRLTSTGKRYEPLLRELVRCAG